MSVSGLAEKIRRLLEEFTGIDYKVEEFEPGCTRLRISPKPLKEESKQVGVRVEVSPEGIFAVGFPGFTRMYKHAERYYQLYMWPDEVMKSRDPNTRKVARRLAPGVIKDCEVVEKAGREAGLKYLADPNSLEIDFNWIKIESRFKVERLSEEEILKEVEKRVKAVNEAVTTFRKWYESEERKNLYEQTRIKKELPYDRTFEVEWPPNTGDPEKDRGIIEDVKRKLSRNHKVYTPKGLLQLKNGEIVLKGKGRRKEEKKFHIPENS